VLDVPILDVVRCGQCAGRGPVVSTRMAAMNPYQSPDSGSEQTPRVGLDIVRVVAGFASLLIGVPALSLWMLLLAARHFPPDSGAMAGFLAVSAIGIGCTTSGLTLLLAPVRRAVPFWTAALWLATLLIAAAFFVSPTTKPDEIWVAGVGTFFGIFAVRGTVLLIRRRPDRLGWGR
jgi:hypothetical protein